MKKGVKAVSKTIVVAGDLILDYNLGEFQTAAEHYHATLQFMVLRQKPGGAWFLEDLVKRACSDLGDVIIRGAPRTKRFQGPGRRINHAHQTWSQYQRTADPHEKKTAWRIKDFLGCRTADPAKTTPLLPAKDPARPDMLVLDDLGLGFRHNEDQWPVSLTRAEGPEQIILKISSPDFDSPLWRRLQHDFADRLTVVLSATALRERGVDLCKALSWDCTIEELVNEFRKGISARDLGLCRRVIVHFGKSGVGVFTRCPLGFKMETGKFPDTAVGDTKSSGKLASKHARFERFIYDPNHCEGTWRTYYPGRVFGDLSILTAAVVRHEIDAATYPLFIALGRALSGMRENHEIGGGSQDKFLADTPYPGIEAAYHPPKGREPADAFCSAYPRYDQAWRFGFGPERGEGEIEMKSDLLRDLTGDRLEYVAAKAVEVVLHGPEKALREAPKARYGKYLTVDRQEIERINTIHNLICTYKDNPEDKKPLSIAVFGPPGSGKSFAIRELLKTVFLASEPLEFNLSQFRYDHGDLTEAFHQVRDASMQGEIPLVFWDEFDVDGLKWLKEFLSPMQDAEFVDRGNAHPLGRAVFVFAGGTCSSFFKFDLSNPGRGKEVSEDDRKDFRDKKGPDFVSRLQGYLDIRGPQPVGFKEWKEAQMGAGPTGQAFEDFAAGSDVAYLIRRAILLRVALQQHCKHLIDPKSKKAAIGADVIHAFLRATEYYHGARSLNSIVRVSDLAHERQFRASSLPSGNLLELRVSDDFRAYLREGRLEAEIIEVLAQACHEAWRKWRIRHKWTYAPERDDANRRNPLLLPYEELHDKDKERNRKTARLTHAKLLDVGYRIVPKPASGSGRSSKPVCSSTERNRLIKIEHDIWLRDHLLNGYEWASGTKESVRLHRDIAVFDAVPTEDQELDGAIVGSIFDTLWENGYTLIKQPGSARKAHAVRGGKGPEKTRKKK